MLCHIFHTVGHFGASYKQRVVQDCVKKRSLEVPKHQKTFRQNDRSAFGNEACFLCVWIQSQERLTFQPITNLEAIPHILLSGSHLLCIPTVRTPSVHCPVFQKGGWPCQRQVACFPSCAEDWDKRAHPGGGDDGRCTGHSLCHTDWQGSASGCSVVVQSTVSFN